MESLVGEANRASKSNSALSKPVTSVQDAPPKSNQEESPREEKEPKRHDTHEVDGAHLVQEVEQTLTTADPPTERKQAWVRVVPSLAPFPTIFDVMPMPELGASVATEQSPPSHTSSPPTPLLLPSQKPLDGVDAIESAVHPQCPTSLLLDGLHDHEKLPIVQALQDEKTYLPPTDVVDLGWADIWSLGWYLAYMVMLLRRDISPRFIILDENVYPQAKSFRPITPAACSVLASVAIPFNQSTEELVIRQHLPSPVLKPKLKSPKKKRKRRGSPRRRYIVIPALRSSIETHATTKSGPRASLTNHMSMLMAFLSKRKIMGAKPSKSQATTHRDGGLRTQAKVGSEGSIAIFRALRVNTKLLSLTLENAGITDSAMGALGAMIRVNCTLLELSLHRNHITYLGLQVLCEALEDSPDSSLVRLDLSRNNITDAGIDALCHALVENETIVWLDISWNRLSSKALLCVLASLRENFALRELSIYGKDIDEDQYCLNLASKYAHEVAASLRRVNSSFASIRLSSEKALLPLDKLKDSRWIALPARELVELDALIISGLIPLNTRLLTLDLSNNSGIERWAILEILKSLKYCKTLKHVNVANTGLYEEVGEQVGDLIASNATLETIIMHERQLFVQQWRGKDPVETLQIAVKPAHHFDRWILAKCLHLNRATQELNQLRLPQASEPLITGAAPKKIGINYSLRKLEVYEVVFLSRKIFYHLHIGRVALNGCEINSFGGVAIADGVRNHASLEVLEIENNQIGEAGGRAMAECVAYNASMTFLNLSWNNLSNGGAIGFEAALKANKTLVRLDLRGNALSAAGITAIASGLKGNACLQELFLRWNTICPVGAEALALALVHNKTLRLLDIEHHTMGARGAAAFTEMLGKNNRLQELNMKGDDSISDGDATGIGSDAAIRLARVMSEKNRTLTNVNLAQNQIGRDGIAAFSDLVKFSTTIKVLDLSIGEMDGKIADRFFECMTMNKSIVKLSLAHNRISNEGMMACVRMLDSNRVLQELNIAHNAITEEPLALLAAKWLKKKTQPPTKGISASAATNPALAPLTIKWLCLIGNAMTEKTRRALLALAPMVDIELDEVLHQGR